MAVSVLSSMMTAGPRTRRQRYEQVWNSLKGQRTSFEAHWKEIADWLYPRRAKFQTTDRNRGDKRNQNIIDSTARFAHRTLASGLHAGLTSPARPWMLLTTPDKRLTQIPSVREWLHEVTTRMLTVFVQSNLYNVLPIIYGDIGAFGVGAMSILRDSKDLFRSYQYPIGSYAFGLSARGVATMFAHEYELSVYATVEEFVVQDGGRSLDWNRVSPTVKTLWDRGDYEESVSILWVVQPNELEDRQRIGAKFLPWASCHMEVGQNTENRFLRESGFKTFPFMCPRWEVTSSSDTYGTDSPAMTALGDIKGLQIMQKEKAKGVAKMVTPPVQGPPELRTQQTNLLPGGITYVATGRGEGGGLRSVYDVQLNLDHLRQDIGEIQYRIQRAFYEDLFLMLARSDNARGAQPITAREVEERHEEKLLALGPVLERTNDELLDPLVDRVFDLMAEAGLIPDPPDELDGVPLRVEYTSILAQAQKLVGVVGLDRFVASTAPIIQAEPAARHKIDMLAIVDEYGDALGINPKIVRSEEEARSIMEQEAQLQAQQLQAQNAESMASAINKVGNTSMSGDTALTRILTGQ